MNDRGERSPRWVHFMRLPSRTPSGQLVSSTVAVRRLSGGQREAMWQLFHCYYDAVSRETFAQDLAAKSDVILLRDSGDRTLQGFATIQTYRRTVQGQRIAVLYNGDTLIGESYWGQTALQKAWLSFAMRFKLSNAHLPSYWFLITKGYKTYLLLSRNFPEYWPRHDLPTPPWQEAVINTLAAEKFGEDFKPDLGVVQHHECMGRLRDGVAPIDDKALEQPDIRFFSESNPGHVHGDELCTLGRIDLALCRAYLTKLGRRAARQLSRRFRERVGR